MISCGLFIYSGALLPRGQSGQTDGDALHFLACGVVERNVGCPGRPWIRLPGLAAGLLAAGLAAGAENCNVVGATLLGLFAYAATKSAAVPFGPRIALLDADTLDRFDA
eukprot:m.454205 g.454205  ORF g.454205 m.454205 type:complete len:109 (-) comp56947_c0_seq3:2719-3045(-)